MTQITSTFTSLFELNLNSPRLGLNKPTLAAIFRRLEAQEGMLQSQSNLLTQISKEELERDLKLAEVAREYRKSLFDVDYDLFGQTLRSSLAIAICAVIACYALGLSSWLSMLVGLFLIFVGALYVLKLYLQANSAYQLWFQTEAVAEILQRAKYKSE